MKISEALGPIANLTGQHLVLTTMGAVSDWPTDRDGPHVFHYVPSSMGQGPALGLGLALAAPATRVIVVNGDGCMLMNLGCLTTIAEQAPKNYSLVVVDNGIYEVTGGQPRVGRESVDFVAIARGCGIANALDFSEGAQWLSESQHTLSAPGPVFIRLSVEPRFGRTSPKPKRPMALQIADVRKVMGLNV